MSGEAGRLACQAWVLTKSGAVSPMWSLMYFTTLLALMDSTTSRTCSRRIDTIAYAVLLQRLDVQVWYISWMNLDDLWPGSLELEYIFHRIGCFRIPAVFIVLAKFSRHIHEIAVLDLLHLDYGTISVPGTEFSRSDDGFTAWIASADQACSTQSDTSSCRQRTLTGVENLMSERRRAPA